VHCPHANADGVVSQVGAYTVIVRVTATYGRIYEVGAEYAWLPMEIEPRAERVLN
jgi:hypothetical protein